MNITHEKTLAIPHRIVLIFMGALLALALLGAYLMRPAHAYTADAFVIRVKTDNPGTSGVNQFTIPTTGSGYNYTVDCDDDGTPEATGRTGAYTCTYPAAGEYTIAITGNFRRIYFNNTGDRQKLLSVEQWGTAAWTSMKSAFYGANNLVINATDTPNLTTPATMSLSQMFRGATALVDNGGAMNSWDTSKVTTLAYMFFGATSFNSPIGSWNTSNVTNLSYMFNGATNFNQNINNWNTSKVTTLLYTFASATNFNQPLNNWDTSKVTSLYGTFQSAVNFNQNINSWDTSKVTTMYYLFDTASKFNQPLDHWNTSNVNNMAVTFRYATAFNQPIGMWDVSKVTTMVQMFSRAENFNQPIGNWNTAALTSTASMFEGARVFNQPLSGWDTSHVTNMSSMFYLSTGVSIFNQDLGTWDVSNVTNMSNMFGGPAVSQRSKLSVSNYDSTLMGWLAKGVKNNVNFVGGRSQFCAATAERATLVATHGWVITDGGKGCPPAEVVITAPTKLRNVPITNVTIVATSGYGDLTIDVADVTLGAATTAGTSGFSCIQTSSVRVDCVVTITSSGNLAVHAVNSDGQAGAAIESNFVIDTTLPQTNVAVDTETHSMHQPILSFTSTDDVAVQRVDVIYTPDNSGPGVGSTTTITGATSPLTLTLDPDEITITGVHTITLRTYDTAGNMSEREVRFPPIITFTAPTVVSNTTINNATVQISSPAGNDIEDIIFIPGTTGATLGSCVGSDNGTSAPYAQPVVCQIHGVASSGTATVRARDAVNGAVGVNSQSFVVDAVSPSVTITAPQKLANHAITTTTLSVTDNYGIDVTGVVIEAVNQVGGFSISDIQCTQVSNSQVDCTLQVDANNGTGDIRVTATDSAGNTTITSESGFLIDTINPVVSITAPTKHSATAITTTTVVVTDTTGINANDVAIAATNEVNGFAISAVTCMQTSATRVDCTLQINASEGRGDIAVNVQDLVGNTASATETGFLIDATPPSITVSAPQKQANGAITSVTATIIDNYAIHAADVVIVATNQVAGFAISSVTCVQTSGVRVDCTLQINDTDGTGDIRVTAADTIGNTASFTEAGFLIDTAGPSIVITAPTKHANTAITTTTIVVTDTVGIDAGNVAITAANVVDGFTLSGIACAQTSATRVDCTLQVDGTEGRGDIVVNAEDLVGNSVSATEPDYMIDHTIPMIMITAPEKESNSAITSVMVSVIDNYQVAAADITITVANQTAGFAISNIICTQTSVTQVDCTLRIDGVQGTGDIAVTVHDFGGNESSASETGFIIDTTAPAVPVAILRLSDDSGVTGDSKTNVSSPTIVIVCSESPSELTLYMNGTLLTTHTCTVTGNVEITLPGPLSDGEYQITYTARDVLGNESFMSVAMPLIIDTALPTVVIERATGQPAVSTSSRALFVLRASKPIMDITTADIILDGTATGKIASVERLSPSEYRIVVTGLSDGDIVTASIRANALIDTTGNVRLAGASVLGGTQSVRYRAPTTPGAPDSGVVMRQGQLSMTLLVLLVIMTVLVVTRTFKRTS